MINRKVLWLLTIIVITLNSCNNSKTIPDKIQNDEPPVKVTVVTVQPDTYNQSFKVSGEIEASNKVKLSTRLMGFVSHIDVNIGDEVNKNQILIKINDTDIKAKRDRINANINEAISALNLAELDYSRYNNLYSNNSASKKELDDMTAKVEMSRARLESVNHMKGEINAQFRYVNIVSPISGIVSGKFVDKGDMANPGKTLLEIESMDQYDVIAMIPESAITKIKKGLKTSVLVKSLNKTIEGKVTEVSVSSKNTGGQYLVKISLEKTNYKILSGMYVTIAFPKEGNELHNMILIPEDVIVNRGQLTGLYTVSQRNTAILRWLRLGKKYGDKYEVLSGLSSNERYISSSNGKLFNGANILIQ